MDNACEDDREDLSNLFRQIVGSIIVLYSTLSAASLMEILQVSSTEMDGALEGLHSVLDITGDVNSPIQLVHPSFRDFLLSSQRRNDPRFLISGDETHTELFNGCLRILSSPLKRNICNLDNEGIKVEEINRRQVKQRIPPHFQYAVQYWAVHLHNSKIGSHMVENSVLDIYSFFAKHFLHWLEVLGISQAGAEAGSLIENLCSDAAQFLPAGAEGEALISFLNDARDFVTHFTALIQKFPLQLYNSALIFSPVESKIRQIFWKEVPSWIKQYPNVPKDWSAVGETVYEESQDSPASGPTAMFFSPNGEILANARGKRVDLWDVKKREHLGTIGQGTPLQSTLAFAPNGEILATISLNDNAIMLWNPDTRKLRATLGGHSAWVRDVVFSPDSKTLASASDDLTIRLWYAMTGKPLTTLEGHSGWVCAVTFSPDGRTLASCSYDKTARLWGVETGELKHTLEGHSGWINSVVFSPDGQVLASASLDQTIRLWNPVSGKYVGCLEGHQAPVTALVFSENSKFVASLAKASEDNTIRLRNVETKETVQVVDSGGFLFRLSFSDDGSKLETNRGRHLAPPTWTITVSKNRKSLLVSARVCTEVYCFRE